MQRKDGSTGVAFCLPSEQGYISRELGGGNWVGPVCICQYNRPLLPMACTEGFLSSHVKPVMQTSHKSLCSSCPVLHAGCCEWELKVQVVFLTLAFTHMRELKQIDATTWKRGRNLGCWNLGMSLVSSVSPATESMLCNGVPNSFMQ